MKLTRSIAAIAAAVLACALPALAASPIQDGAGLFSPGTVSRLDQQISDFSSQTGKQIVVVTVPSLNGQSIADAAHQAFSSQDVNGVLIYIAKTDRQDYFVTGASTAQFFPAETLSSIRTTMESQFRDGDYDGGITSAVEGLLNVFRAHLSSAPAAGNARTYPVTQTYPVRARQGAHFPVFFTIILIIVAFLVIRSIFRAMSGPRYYGPGVPPGAGGYGGGYGPYPGYGGGYYGGGGFWSGLLGGLGGAWLGNEMFGNHGTTIVDNNAGGNVMPTDQGGSWGAPDQGGWGNDAGQIGGGSGGDWSGGGFGGDGGGGFGGGDFGGGGFGGDSGGGW